MSGITGLEDKIYDASTDANIIGTPQLEGIFPDDEGLVLISTYTAHFNDENASNNIPGSIEFTLEGDKAPNYLVEQLNDIAGNILPKELTVSGITGLEDKIYDGSTQTEILGTPVLADIMPVDIGLVEIDEIEANFDDASAGNNIPGTISISLTGAKSPNYFINEIDSYSGDIFPKEIEIIEIIAQNKTYDGNTDAVISGGSLNAVITGDDVTANIPESGSFDDKNVGNDKPVSIAIIDLSGVDKDNYTLIQPDNLTADILPKELNIVDIEAEDKTYDGNTDAVINGGALEGLVTGDDVTANIPESGSFDDKNVGNDKPVSIAIIDLSGVDKDNYTLIQPVGLTANINKLEINLLGTFSVLDKVYDGTTEAEVDENNLYLWETVDGDDIDFDFTVEFTQASQGTDIPVIINWIILTGNDSENYELLTTDLPETTGNIDPPLLVDNNEQSIIQVYPNPFSDFIIIKSKHEVSEIILTNISGQKVKQIKKPNSEIIYCTDLPAGVYFLSVVYNGGNNNTFKLIKQD